MPELASPTVESLRLATGAGLALFIGALAADRWLLWRRVRRVGEMIAGATQSAQAQLATALGDPGVVVRHVLGGTEEIDEEERKLSVSRVVANTSGAPTAAAQNNPKIPPRGLGFDACLIIVLTCPAVVSGVSPPYPPCRLSGLNAIRRCDGFGKTATR